MAEKVKKSLPWILTIILFSLVAVFILNLGKPTSIVEADIATTTVTVGNGAPTWEIVYEDPASSSSTPTNAGLNVTFKGRADDPNDEDWYLIICSTSTQIATTSGDCPVCPAGSTTWATSTAADNATATATYTTSNGDEQENAWWAWACDNNSSDQKCSSASQGTGGTGPAYSPFAVNHRPDFTEVTQNPSADPGSYVTWTATSSDTDDFGGTDTVKLLVCDAQGVSGTNCSGSQLCLSSLVTSNPFCSSTIADPEADATYAAWVYVFDVHDFAASGAPHDTDAQYTVNNVSPVVSDVTLNAGSNIDLQSGGEGPTGSTTIIATANIVDHNGCADVATVTVKAYPTGVGAGGCSSQNNNTCYYNISCATGTCQGDDFTATTSCSISFWYHADPTDNNTPRVSETWKDTIEAQDEALSDSDELVTGVELISFLSLNVTSQIQYGALALGQITDETPLPKTATSTATGNTGLDIELSGTQMCTDYATCTENTINATSTKYATSSVNYASSTAYELTGTPTELELNCPKTIITASPEEKANWWGIQIPIGTGSGSYTGENTFTAVMAETGDW